MRRQIAIHPVLFKELPTARGVGIPIRFGSEPSESLDQSTQSNKETLKRGGNLPTRTASELEEKLPKSLPLGDVIIDGTERPVERPQDKEEQKEKYSGKNAKKSSIGRRK